MGVLRLRVKHVWIKGYRNLRDTEFSVSDRLVLIGENNSGKSNVLKAITYPMLTGSEGPYTRSMSPRDLNDLDKKEYFVFLKKHIKELVDQGVPPELLKKFELTIPQIIIRLQFEVDRNSMFYFEKLCTKGESEELTYELEFRYQIQDLNKLLARFKELMAAIPDQKFDVMQYQINLLPASLFKSSIRVPGKNEPVTYDLLKNMKSYALVAERDGFSSTRKTVGSSAIVELLNSNINDESKLKIEDGYHQFFEQVKGSAKMEEVFNWPKNSIKYANADQFLGEISILPNMPPMNRLLNSVQLGYAQEPLSQQGLGYRNLVYLMAMINALENDAETPFAALTVEEPEAHLSNENQKLLMGFLDATSKASKNVQLMYSTHNTNFLSKDSLDDIVVMNEGQGIALSTVMEKDDLLYLMRNPNMDLYKLLFSTNVMLVEGISEELLIKSYLREHSDELNNIEVLSFHKGYNRIIDLWMKINSQSKRKIAVIRDYDNQSNAKKQAESRSIPGKVFVGTTEGYTLEDDIVKYNIDLLRSYFIDHLNWNIDSSATASEIASVWKSKKGETMSKIAFVLGTNLFHDFLLPKHINAALKFLKGESI